MIIHTLPNHFSFVVVRRRLITFDKGNNNNNKLHTQYINDKPLLYRLLSLWLFIWHFTFDFYRNFIYFSTPSLFLCFFINAWNVRRDHSIDIPSYTNQTLTVTIKSPIKGMPNERERERREKKNGQMHWFALTNWFDNYELKVCLLIGELLKTIYR